jgi:hypothetical protein
MLYPDTNSLFLKSSNITAPVSLKGKCYQTLKSHGNFDLWCSSNNYRQAQIHRLECVPLFLIVPTYFNSKLKDCLSDVKETAGYKCWQVPTVPLFTNFIVIVNCAVWYGDYMYVRIDSMYVWIWPYWSLFEGREEFIKFEIHSPVLKGQSHEIFQLNFSSWNTSA